MQTRDRRIRIRPIVLLVIGFLCWLAIRVPIGIKQNEKLLQTVLPETYSISAEDSSVFAPDREAKIKAIVVNNSTVRAPISILRYNEEYNILLSKIELNQENSLPSILHEKAQNSKTSTGYSYRVLRRDIMYEFNCLSAQPEKANQIFLTLSGDSLSTVVKGDSIVSFHLNCHNLSIRYSEDGPVDIFVQGEEKLFGTTSKIPMDILFYKRGKFVYMLLMTPMKHNNSIASNLLYKTVTGG